MGFTGKADLVVFTGFLPKQDITHCLLLKMNCKVGEKHFGGNRSCLGHFVTIKPKSSKRMVIGYMRSA